MENLSAPDFTLTPELAMVLSSAKKLLRERAPMTAVRATLDESVSDHDPARWRAVAELGWLGLAIPEARGGAGLGLYGLALVVEEMGRVLWPGPFLPSALAALLLSELPGSGDLLAHVVSGDSIAVLGMGATAGDPECLSVIASDGGRLEGVLSGVAGAHVANVLVVPAKDASGSMGVYAVDVPGEGVIVEAERVVDPTRRSARVTLSGAKGRRIEGDAARAVARTASAAATLLAAELSGAAETVLRTTRDYAVERRQFDKPIGSFQAVKFPLVDTMIGIELARSLALAAALDFDGGAASPLRAHMAKAMAGDVATDACRRGVQLHGGFGFTWDCDVHLFLRRSLVSRALWGDSAHHRRAVLGELSE